MSLPRLTEQSFEENIKNFNGEALVCFSAKWCGPCRILKPILEEIHLLGYNVFIVDIDEEQELTSKFSISSVPTTIVFKDGEEAERFLSVVSKSKLIDSIDN